MNTKNVIIALLLVAILIIAISAIVKNVTVKKSAVILNRVNSENEKSILSLANSYDAKREYAKARNAFSEFLAKFPGSKDAAYAEKKIEDLNLKLLFSEKETADSVMYEIKPGDTLSKIAAKFETTVPLIKKANNLKTDIIIPGKVLKVNKTKFCIVVDKSDNMLILKKASGETVKTYTVATGENSSTPEGTFKIEEKLISPVWYKIGAVVDPASPEYELGSRWLGLSVSGYGIHGTKDERTIGQHITNGCVRMRNADVEELYNIVPSGTEVTIVE